jgi:ribosomal protein S27AE
MKVLRSDAVTCPRCGARGVPILFGRPADAASEARRDGALVLAGCLVRQDGSDPQWQCSNHRSHQWTDGDPQSPRWLAAIDEALRGRPHCPVCGSTSFLLVYRHAAGIFAHELAAGTARLTDEHPPSGVNARHRCDACHHTWP